MLRILRTAIPFSNLQRPVVMPLLGSQYRPLSKASHPHNLKSKDKIESFGKLTIDEYEEFNRLVKFVKSRGFNDLITLLKSTPSTTPYVFQRILLLKFEVEPSIEVAVKEQIVEIMEKRGQFLRASSIFFMIVLYGRARNFKKADAMFQRMKDYGIERKSDVYNALIKCHERDLPRAEVLFKEMVTERIVPNIITYNSMIKAYALNGKVYKTEELLDRMAKQGIKPSLISLTTIIKAYTLRGQSQKSVELLGRMLEAGIKPDRIALDTIKRAFAKDGKIEELFSRMDGESIDRMVELWDVKLLGAAPRLPASEGIRISAPPLSSIPSSSISMHSASELEEIDRLLLLVKSLKFDDLFSALKSTPFLSYALFRGILQPKFEVEINKEIETKENIVKIMGIRGLALDAGTIASMILLYGRAGDVKKADELLKTMKDYRIERTTDVYNALIKCHERDLSKVESLYEEITKEWIRPDFGIFNSMLNAYSLSGDHDKKSVELCDRMITYGIVLDRSAYQNMIKVYLNNGDLLKALRICSRMMKDGNTIPLGSDVVNTMRRAIEMEEKEIVKVMFSRMEDDDRVGLIKIFFHSAPPLPSATLSGRKGISSAPSFTSATGHGGNVIEEDFLFQVGREDDLIDVKESDGIMKNGAPDDSSFVPIIGKYGKNGEWVKGRDEVKKDDEIERTAAVYNALIKSHEHDLSRVDAIFMEMIENGIEPDEYTYSSVIQAYSKGPGSGFEKMADLFSRMVEEKRGDGPDVDTYNFILALLSKSGDLVRAEEICYHMLEVGIKPDLKTFNLMKRIYARCGSLEQASAFLSRMEEAGFRPPMGNARRENGDIGRRETVKGLE
jgi:pentatricopeptide repeat protein